MSDFRQSAAAEGTPTATAECRAQGDGRGWGAGKKRPPARRGCPARAAAPPQLPPKAAQRCSVPSIIISFSGPGRSSSPGSCAGDRIKPSIAAGSPPFFKSNYASIARFSLTMKAVAALVLMALAGQAAGAGPGAARRRAPTTSAVSPRCGAEPQAPNPHLVWVPPPPPRACGAAPCAIPAPPTLGATHRAGPGSTPARTPPPPPRARTRIRSRRPWPGAGAIQLQRPRLRCGGRRRRERYGLGDAALAGRRRGACAAVQPLHPGRGEAPCCRFARRRGFLLNRAAPAQAA
jgi:hypothetical protein